MKMINTCDKELPFLVSLSRDSNPKVQRRVAEALLGYGQRLRKELNYLEEQPSPEDLISIYTLLKTYFKDEKALREHSKFYPGQLVSHRHYGYRGVIVDLDLYCMADEQWYNHNRTCPEKNQPWYHVLVDDSVSTTYAAESNLEQDTIMREVSHPYIQNFFSKFLLGKYVRNTIPWPSF